MTDPSDATPMAVAVRPPVDSDHRRLRSPWQSARPAVRERGGSRHHTGSRPLRPRYDQRRSAARAGTVTASRARPPTATAKDPYISGGTYGASPVTPLIIGISVAAAIAEPRTRPTEATSRPSQRSIVMTWRRVEPTRRSVPSSRRRFRTVIIRVLTAATAAKPPRTAAMVLFIQ